MKLDYWRQITRLKHVEEFQSAFIKGRNIHNNVRLILNMLDYQSRIESESFILFIDFFKAFDSTEHALGNAKPFFLVISFARLLRWFLTT